MRRLLDILDLASPSPTVETLAGRYRGAMLGLAAGNVLGLPVEGYPRTLIARHHPEGLRDIPREEKRLPWDDDLAQAVILAESIVEFDRLEVEDLASRLLAWRRANGRGMGHLTRRVLDAIENGASPHDAARVVWEDTGKNAAGNGAVMRCAPAALRWRRDPERLVAETNRSALATHFDPRCGWSSVVVNIAIAAALEGRRVDPADLADAVDEAGAPAAVGSAVRASAGVILDALVLDHDNSMGYTLKAMQAGLWALEQDGSAEETLIAIVNAGGDTDTNGAVAGAALGALHGESALPKRWIENIAGTSELTDLAEQLLERATG
ncbi:MAG: ADP-ribosylglycohydrolase family protein [Candidatus Eisenbacteria bacterium]